MREAERRTSGRVVATQHVLQSTQEEVVLHCRLGSFLGEEGFVRDWRGLGSFGFRQQKYL